MLANFGKVQAWMLTPADIVNERAPAPPSTSSAQMGQELAEVKSVSDGLTSAQLAIAQKWNDGAATPTPPGHWNDIASEQVSGAGWSEVRAARAFALLNMAMEDAVIVCWDTKFDYFNPRPSQLDPSIRTKIGLPNFPSYISGHSTFSAAAAAVLSHLFPSSASSFASMRDEAAISRLYAAIHYRADIETGKVVGGAGGRLHRRVRPPGRRGVNAGYARAAAFSRMDFTIAAPWKRPFSMKTLWLSAPATIAPAR